MKFTVDRNDLAIAVTHAVHGIPNNPLQPIRAGMFIWYYDGAVAFTGSDGDVTFTGHVPCEASGGDVIVPGKLFTDVVRALPPGDVEFVVQHDFAVLKCGRVKFTFPVIPGDYPQFLTPVDFAGEVEAGMFTDMVRKVVPACSRTGTHPALGAVRFEPDGTGFLAAGTDRYRLAAARGEWKPLPGAVAPENACLVPSWAAERFTRTIDGMVELGWDDRVVSLRSGALSVTSRLLSGEWPKGWRNLLSPPDCPVEVSTPALLAALKRAALAAEMNAPVELIFTPGHLYVEAGVANTAYDVLDASYTGDEFHVLFGISFLTDGLQGCGEVTRFGFTAPDRPVYLASGSYSYTVLPRKPR